MHLSPGAPIMKSYDLVNWEIVNYVFDRADISDSFSLRNGQYSYGQGQWASSIRYHDGKCYVAFNTNNLGGVVPLRHRRHRRRLVGAHRARPGLPRPVALLRRRRHAVHLLRLRRRRAPCKLSSRPEDRRAGVPADLHAPPTTPARSFIGGLFEGAQVQYIDGKYYIVIITWPSGQGRQVALFRSDDAARPLRDGRRRQPVRGARRAQLQRLRPGQPRPHRRARTARPTGTGMFFRDTFPIGRIPALIPATWQDGWPTFGNNGVGARQRRVRQADRAQPGAGRCRAAEEHRRLGRLRQRRAAPGVHGRGVDDPGAAERRPVAASASSCCRTPDSRAARPGGSSNDTATIAADDGCRRPAPARCR